MPRLRKPEKPFMVGRLATMPTGSANSRWVISARPDKSFSAKPAAAPVLGQLFVNYTDTDGLLPPGVGDLLRKLFPPAPTSCSGGDPTIRNVPGGQQAAQDVYDRLSQGGTSYGGDYPGSGVALPDGGFVGIRGADTPTPTIDVNIPGVPEVSKLHF